MQDVARPSVESRASERDRDQAPTVAWPGALSWIIEAMPWLALVGSFAFTLLLYGRALGFSYFLDDAFDLTRTEAESYWSLLSRPLPHYVYYRPIPFMLWKALYDLTGAYGRFPLHLLPIAAHALSAWLLFMLLRRFTNSLWSLVPAVLFLTYPFSYQAVEILGTLVHTLVTVQILAVLLLWYDGRTRGSSLRLAAASVFAATALWTHEYGAAILPLLLGMEALFWFQRRISRPTLWLLAPAVAEVLYLWLWFTMDKPEPDAITNGDIIGNIGFWLQGFAYPFTRQTNWLTSLVGGDPLRVGLLIGIAGILAGLAIHALGRQLWAPLIALGWGAVTFLPAVATLTYEYMQNGPRLLYVVSPGCAVFWGLLPMIRFKSQRATLIWRVGTLALLAIVVVQSVLFIERRTVMLDHGTVAADGVIEQSVARADRPVLMLNVPAWFAFKTQEFPRGHLGAQIEPSYIGLERLVLAGSGVRMQVESRSLAPDVSGWLYNFQPHGPPIDHNEIDAKLRAGAALLVTDLYHDTLAVREPGTIAVDQPMPAAYSATFGDALRFLDATLTRDGDLAQITTRWYATSQLGADYQLWVQLLNTDGQVVAERKDYALRGMSPPRLWQPGDLIDDRLVLDLSQIHEPGPLEVRVGLVNTANGDMLAPVLPDGRRLPGSWLEVGRIESVK